MGYGFQTDHFGWGDLETRPPATFEWSMRIPADSSVSQKRCWTFSVPWTIGSDGPTCRFSAWFSKSWNQSIGILLPSYSVVDKFRRECLYNYRISYHLWNCLLHIIQIRGVVLWFGFWYLSAHVRIESSWHSLLARTKGKNHIAQGCSISREMLNFVHTMLIPLLYTSQSSSKRLNVLRILVLYMAFHP